MNSEYHYPLAELENGKILLHRKFKKIVSYNPETE